MTPWEAMIQGKVFKPMTPWVDWDQLQKTVAEAKAMKKPTTSSNYQGEKAKRRKGERRKAEKEEKAKRQKGRKCEKAERQKGRCPCT